jgi:chorismate mutase/prephenate dehydrogenase
VEERGVSYEEEVERYRSVIDALNGELVELLRRRVDAALEVGRVKRRHGRPVRDRAREEAVVGRVRAMAESLELDPTGVERVLRDVIRLCLEAEEAAR